AAVRPYEVVVADPRREPVPDAGGVDDDAHPRSDLQRLLGTDQRPLDEVVTLSVGVEAPLRAAAVRLQEGVVTLPDLGGGRTGSQEVEAEALRLDRERELLDQLRRRFPEDAGATELGVEAPRP